MAVSFANNNLNGHTRFVEGYITAKTRVGVTVAELEGYHKVMEAARQTITNYKPSFRIDPNWPIVQLRDIIQEKPKNGYSAKPVPYPTNLKVLTLTATTSGTLDISQFKYVDEDIPVDSPCRCRRGDIYLQRGNTRELVGTAALFDVNDPDFIYPDLMIRVRAKEDVVISEFLLHALQSKPVREFVETMQAAPREACQKSTKELSKTFLFRFLLSTPRVRSSPSWRRSGSWWRGTGN